MDAYDEARAALHEAWRRQAQVFLDSMGKSADEARSARKSEPWKLAIAAAMKATSTATNRWLASHLGLGTLHEASRKVTAWQRNPDATLGEWLKVQITNHKA